MQKPTNSTLLNFCILPNEKVSEECISLSKTIASADTMFSLGGNLFPHMTVYMARFPESAITPLVNILKNISTNASAFRIEYAGFYLTPGNYLEVSYKKSTQLINLHTLLISEASQYRVRPGNPNIENYFAPYTEKQKRNAIETGYDLANELYRPHITLTRYREGSELPDISELSADNLSFPLAKLAVYKADDNGAVYECIKDFSVH